MCIDPGTGNIVLVGQETTSSRSGRNNGAILVGGVHSVMGSGPSAEITNVSLGGAHSDFGDVILSGFSFTKDGASAQAMELTVALIDRTGALDTNFNGTGHLINADYGEAVLDGVMSTHVGNNDGTATDLDIVYGTVGSAAAQFVDSPITNGIPDLTNPTVTKTGTFTGLQGSASQTTTTQPRQRVVALSVPAAYASLVYGADGYPTACGCRLHLV